MSMPFSTDMGDVSYVVPAIQPTIGVDAGGAVNHQAAFAAFCVTPQVDALIRDAATAMAWTVIEAASDEAMRERLLAKAR
jgi:hypothetical protein